MRRRDVLLASCAGPLAWAAQARAQPAVPKGALVLVVAVGRETPLKGLDLGELRALFLGEVVDDDVGKKLVALNQPPQTPERVAFDKVVLGMSPEQAGRYWVDRRIRGGGRPPRAFEAAQLVRLVAKFPGAIAYLRAEHVDASVRIVTIDGKTPKDAGYPLVARG